MGKGRAEKNIVLPASKPKGKRRGKVSVVLGGAFLVLAALVFVGTNMFSGVLDAYVGRGQMTVSHKPGSENWDTAYYKNDYASGDEATSAAREVTRKIAEEGITLLKNNDGTLPIKGDSPKVTLLGRRSVDTIIGGTGSGSGDASQATSLVDALTNEGFQVNTTVTDMYSANLDSVPTANNQMDDPSKQTYYIGEFPQSYYSGEVLSSFADYNDAAIVVLGRQGGEGVDFSTNLKSTLDGSTAMDSSIAEVANYEDGQHQLELSKEEIDLIQLAESHFDKVVVVINSANVMELGDLQNDPRISAIVWMSYPGSTGTEALAEILKGEINPSGHTVDTWAADLTADPTFPNTNSRKYSNVDKSNALGDAYTVDYEEGIYVGYRYYETAYADGAIDYDSAVVYPFGYGLSYTTFDQELKSCDVSDGKVNATVTVTNTGDVAGRDAVQVYYSAPYDGTVEKSAVVLGGFGKTKLLEPGESEDVTVSWNVDEMASYDYKGAGCYVLDAGDYVISVRKNAHEVYGENCTYTYNVPEKVIYDSSNPRPTEIEDQTGDAVNMSEDHKSSHEVVAATNRFDNVSSHFVDYSNPKEGKAVNLTRSNFSGSWPTSPTAADLTASDEVISAFGKYTPDYYDSSDSKPTTEASNGLSVVGMRGLTYDDPKWDELLDQLSVKDMVAYISGGNQGTPAIASVNLPASKATDGPAGLKQYGGVGMSTTGNFNCSSTLTAATFNVELAQEYGVAVGNEALAGSENGWYAPGCNIHRSAFSGRNFEYYSEDPVLSGAICAGTIQGAATKGVTCYMKHFALNDEELHRTNNGFCVWANEQAMREIYLKAFQIAVEMPVVKESYLDEQGNTQTKTIRATTGIMSSFNRIGDTWTGGCDELLKGVLRDEWGFEGTVITDYNSSDFMNIEEGVSSGNDLMLANTATLPSKFKDQSNPSSIKAMRAAMKNCLYTQANSNTVNGTSAGDQIVYALSTWQIAAYVVEAVLGVSGIALVAHGILSRRKNKTEAKAK